MGGHRGIDHIHRLHVQRRQRKLQNNQRSADDKRTDSEAPVSRLERLLRWIRSSIHRSWRYPHDHRPLLRCALLLLPVLQPHQARIQIYFRWVAFDSYLWERWFLAAKRKREIVYKIIARVNRNPLVWLFTEFSPIGIALMTSDELELSRENRLKTRSMMSLSDDSRKLFPFSFRNKQTVSGESARNGAAKKKLQARVLSSWWFGVRKFMTFTNKQLRVCQMVEIVSKRLRRGSEGRAVV